MLHMKWTTFRPSLTWCQERFELRRSASQLNINPIFLKAEDAATQNAAMSQCEPNQLQMLM